MLVRDAMSTVVLTIGPAHTLRQAACLMSSRRVGAAVVHDEDSSGLGILAERDILNSIALGQNPDTETAGTHTTTDVVFAAPVWTLEEAAAAMAHRRFPTPDRARRHRPRSASSRSATSSAAGPRSGSGYPRRRPRTPSGHHCRARSCRRARDPHHAEGSGPPPTTSDPVPVVSRAGPGPRPPAACRILRQPDGSC